MQKPTLKVLRDDAYDREIVNEMRTYMPVFDHYRGGTIMDIGGHIGSFTVMAQQVNPPQTIVIEPNPDNIELLRTNTDDYPTVTVLQGAVTKCGGEQASFYKPETKNKGIGGLTPVRGRTMVTVETFGFSALLEQYTPEIIKMDIEGGEYFLLEELAVLPPYVKSIAMEIHLQGKHNTVQRRLLGAKLLANLYAQFRDCHYGRITDSAWHITFVGHRL